MRRCHSQGEVVASMRRFQGARLLLVPWIWRFALATASGQAPTPSNLPEEPFSWLLYTREARANLSTRQAPAARVALEEVDLLATPFYTRTARGEAAVGLAFQWYGLKFDGLAWKDLDLYTLGVPLGALWTSGLLHISACVTPALFSDFEHLTEDDFRTLAEARVSRAWREGAEWVAGFGYDRRFGEDRLYPILGLAVQAGTYWGWALVFPTPHVTWAPTSRLLLFAQAEPAGGLWNVRDPDTGEEFDLALEGYRVGAGVEYRWAPHLWLQVAAGTCAERRYEMGQGGGNRWRADAEDACFARAGIVVR